MYGASDQLFPRSRFSRNQAGRIRGRNFRHLCQHSPQGFGGANDLLKHRRALDLFAQRDVLISQAIFGLFMIFNVRSCPEPLDNVSVLIEQRVTANQEPSIPPIFSAQPLSISKGIRFERPALSPFSNLSRSSG